MSTVLNDTPDNQQAVSTDELTACLKQQREAYHADPVPGLEQRKKDLLALKSMLADNREAIVDAINADYGSRSRHETMLAEIIMVLDGFNFAAKHLKQ